MAQVSIPEMGTKVRDLVLVAAADHGPCLSGA